jgi:hypothetical protein
VGPKEIVRTRNPKIPAVLVAAMLLSALCSAAGRREQANSQHPVERQPASSVHLVIQGRITDKQGDLVTVKTPDGYPGGPGVHAQFVTAGPAFKVDVSRARILLPDGRHADQVPLLVGDRVLAVLSGPDSGPPIPGGVSPSYFASIVERVIESDKIVTH